MLLRFPPAYKTTMFLWLHLRTRTILGRSAEKFVYYNNSLNFSYPNFLHLNIQYPFSESCISILFHIKTTFYCINTSYPMDNCFTGRHDRTRQTPEKDVLYILPAGPVTECAFARWRIVLPFLSRQSDVIASFSFVAESVQTCFVQRNVFEVLQRTLSFYVLLSIQTYF